MVALLQATSERIKTLVRFIKHVACEYGRCSITSSEARGFYTAVCACVRKVVVEVVFNITTEATRVYVTDAIQRD